MLLFFTIFFNYHYFSYYESIWRGKTHPIHLSKILFPSEIGVKRIINRQNSVRM